MTMTTMANPTEDLRYRIEVDVETRYVPEQSDPDKQRYMFTYTVTLRNSGTVSAQLLNRHWIITDGDQKVQEVRGEGVVGKQPKLDPGESFTYTSGTSIETQVGTMHGNYEMVGEDGHQFLAAIPAFTLALPNSLH